MLKLRPSRPYQWVIPNSLLYLHSSDLQITERSELCPEYLSPHPVDRPERSGGNAGAARPVGDTSSVVFRVEPTPGSSNSTVHYS